MHRADQVVADQHPVDRGPARQRPDAPLAQLVTQPTRTPPRMIPTDACTPTPPPRRLSDADTTPDDATDPPTRAAHRAHSGPSTSAPSAAIPRTGRPPQSSATRPGPPSRRETVAPQRSTPEVPPGLPSPALQAKRARTRPGVKHQPRPRCKASPGVRQIPMSWRSWSFFRSPNGGKLDHDVRLPAATGGEGLTFRGPARCSRTASRSALDSTPVQVATPSLVRTGAPAGSSSAAWSECLVGCVCTEKSEQPHPRGHRTEDYLVLLVGGRPCRSSSNAAACS